MITCSSSVYTRLNASLKILRAYASRTVAPAVEKYSWTQVCSGSSPAASLLPILSSVTTTSSRMTSSSSASSAVSVISRF